MVASSREAAVGARDLRDAPRIAHPACLHQRVVGRRIELKNIDQRLRQAADQRAAHAAVGQADRRALRAEISAASIDKVAEVVDQHRHVPCFGLGKNRVDAASSCPHPGSRRSP